MKLFMSASKQEQRKSSTKKRYPSSLGLIDRITRPKIPVANVHEFRRALLDQEYDLSQIRLSNQLLQEDDSSKTPEEQVQETLVLNHDVLQLMKSRFLTGSTPGHRSDNASLALAIEGGGMRGCVSAGMAAAIASLGLTDTFDTIYGSSAGSVVGSYMVSRQMCIDVYVDILPAAKKRFVSKGRMVRILAQSFAEVLVCGMYRNSSFQYSMKQDPGMNISFLLDGIMGVDQGLRKFDMDKFEQNNKLQPLRVVASCVDSNDQMVTKCFGSEDFFGDNSVRRADGSREGLFACLEASMSVPGATGPPIAMVGKDTDLKCFDALCFEPIPYRSAVEEGATHVLALCSRPQGQPRTKPGPYESAMAPLYFHSHGHYNIGHFFENGGQTYIYAEDLLTLKDGKQSPNKPVLVPPPTALYGLNNEADRQKARDTARHRETEWNRAHLFPLQVPSGTPEIGTLEQDRNAILRAVRGGYSAAFDLLAPIVGLRTESMGISGAVVAKLVFPDETPTRKALDLRKWLNDDHILNTELHVPGESISLRNQQVAPVQAQRGAKSSHGLQPHNLPLSLLMALPGFQDGRLSHLSKGLRYGSSLSPAAAERRMGPTDSTHF
eukprot:Nitzschia sp. Nitz4//scaffold68_size99682//33909//35732//NITZ4_004560-RA/size99682-processed-gene-0.74-mRNA-1//1//CDS//3329556581//7121//frame0